jgi:ABC-type amino acid transport substrate-binding protein
MLTVPASGWRGHASTIALVRLLKQAQPVYAETYDPTFELLRSGNADAFASIREMLIQYSAQLPGSRVLEPELPRGLQVDDQLEVC